MLVKRGMCLYHWLKLLNYVYQISKNKYRNKNIEKVQYRIRYRLALDIEKQKAVMILCNISMQRKKQHAVLENKNILNSRELQELVRFRRNVGGNIIFYVYKKARTISNFTHEL